MSQYDVYLWDSVGCRYDGTYPYYYYPAGEKKKINTIYASSYNNALYKARKWAKENDIRYKRITVKKVY